VTLSAAHTAAQVQLLLDALEQCYPLLDTHEPVEPEHA
jgi:8-amino-7-oxononanoate synthase